MWAETSPKWAVLTPGRGKSLCKGLGSETVWWTVCPELRGTDAVRRTCKVAYLGSRQAILSSLCFDLAISVEYLKRPYQECKGRSCIFEKLWALGGE